MSSPELGTTTTAATGRGRRLAVFAGVLAVGYAVDQVTKVLAVAHLDPQRPVPVIGDLLTLRLIRNPGAAFSMGESVTIVFTLLAMAALVAGFAVVLKLTRTWQTALLGLAMAGIAGNLTDRLLRAPAPLHGHVVDFFAVPGFAIFNVADIWLTVAAGIVIVHSLLEGRREGRAASAERVEG